MDRLTTTNKDVSREMICRNEDCGVTEEHCPHLMEDECYCLHEVINKLAEYEDAEEQGVLKMLPVAVGTKVYYPLRPCGFTTFTIVKIAIYEDEILFEDDCENAWEERHLGKVLFLTPEEAESALAEKGGAE